MKLTTIISTFLNSILILLLIGCGFKIVDKNFLNDYKISEIIVTGDKKISYLLKNNMRFSNTKNESSKNINIQVEVIKDKIIKEKNIQNQITKYQITVKANVTFEMPEIKKIDNFTIIENRRLLTSRCIPLLYFAELLLIMVSPAMLTQI